VRFGAVLQRFNPAFIAKAGRVERWLLRWTPLSTAAAEFVFGRLVTAALLLGPGDQRGGNDDCHSEIRGSGPQDSVRSLSCLALGSRVGIAEKSARVLRALSALVAGPQQRFGS
jgi:hypothetical protein